MEPYQMLEQELAKWAGVQNVCACSSGTAALHLALEALRLPPGSRCLVPDYTMIACARAVTLAGLEPVFVDCTDDLLIDIDLVDEVCSREEDIRAVMAVHVYGRRCPMDALHALAKKYDLLVIEDLAEAHGVAPHPATDAAAWSFYRNKIIAGEEGGAVSFRDPEAASLARQLRSLGFTEDHDFTHIPRGHNYRLANALARLILLSLARVEAALADRRRIERWCDAHCPPEWRQSARQAPWVYDVRIPGLEPEQQDSIVRRLQDMGIAARHGFKRMSCQSEYRVPGRGFTRAARAAREVVYLPLTPDVPGKLVDAFGVMREALAG